MFGPWGAGAHIHVISQIIATEIATWPYGSRFVVQSRGVSLANTRSTLTNDQSADA
jgi:hypothetical protein